MSDCEYGIVVEQYSRGFGIWRLFKGNDCSLSLLDPSKCSDALRIGNIVQARTNGDETRTRRAWPFPDSVWTENDRIVVRSIVRFSSELTIDCGRWKDNSGFSSVLLISRDIGVVVASPQWYNRNFFEPNESNLLVYAEFFPQQLISMRTDNRVDFFWRIVEDRICLPAVPSNDEDPRQFLNWNEIRKVPVLTFLRKGNSMLTWSYALGDHIPIIMGEHLDIGQWRMATVTRSSTHELRRNGWMYSVTSHEPAASHSQPEVKFDRGKISMVLILNRCVRNTGNFYCGVHLWHEYWGLPVNYDEENMEWIRGESIEFRAVVEIGRIIEDVYDGNRVTIKAIGPARMPRLVDSPLPTSDSPTGHYAFENLDELKAALLERERTASSHSEWAWPPEELANEHEGRDESLPPDGRRDTSSRMGIESRQSTEMESIKNDNMKKDAYEWKTKGGDETTCPIESNDGWKKRELEMKKQKESNIVSSPPVSWSNTPKKEMKERNYGKEKEKEKEGVCAKQDEKASRKESSRGEFKTETVSDRGDPSKEEIEKSIQKGFSAPLTSSAKRDKFDNGHIVDSIPIRARDDRTTERKWRREMEKKGWEMPPEIREIIIPEGEDGWDQTCSKTFGRMTPKTESPMPIQDLFKRPTIVKDLMKLKRKRCLITKVRFDEKWKEADRIQLYIIDDTPGYIVYRMDSGRNSYLKNLPEFATVGNVVEVNVGRNAEGFYVYDEMWRPTTKLKLPYREVISEPGRFKSIELIVNANCLSPEKQVGYNNRHRFEENPFIILTDDLLKKIIYYGPNINAKEHEDYTFQMVVQPGECLDGLVHWKAKEVLWRIKKEPLGFGPSPPRPPTMNERQIWTPPKPRRPVDDEVW